MAVDTPPTVADKAVYWSRDPAALLDELRSGAQGLASTEALRRLQQEGPNAIDEEPAAGIARLLLRQFTSPLVLILVFGGVVSAALRDWLDAAIILAVVLGSSGLGFLQEYRASNAVAQLRSRLALTARVLRDGRRRVVPTQWRPRRHAPGARFEHHIHPPPRTGRETISPLRRGRLNWGEIGNALRQERHRAVDTTTLR